MQMIGNGLRFLGENNHTRRGAAIMTMAALLLSGCGIVDRGMDRSAEKFQQDFIGQDLPDSRSTTTGESQSILEFDSPVFDVNDSASQH